MMVNSMDGRVKDFKWQNSLERVELEKKAKQSITTLEHIIPENYHYCIDDIKEYMKLLEEENYYLKNLDTIVPFTVYKRYHDKRVVKKQIFHVTNHAVKRFIERFNKIAEVNPDRVSDLGKSRDDPVEVFITAFQRSQKINTDNSKYAEYFKARRKKHNYASEYFSDGLFMFVVSNGFVVTVEICDDQYRHLN